MDAASDLTALIGNVTGTRQPGAFTSDDLPAGLDDRARFSFWRDMYVAAYCEFDLRRLEDRPFFASSAIRQFGAIGVGSTQAAVDRLVRRKRQVESGSRSNFCFALSRNGASIVQVQQGREIVHRPNCPALVNEGAAGEVGQAQGFDFNLIDIPPSLLLERVPNAEDLVAAPLLAAPEAAAHLRRYLDLLPCLVAEVSGDPLSAHVETTLIDLVSLVLGAQRDAAELARTRGLRSARLQDVLLAIRRNFRDPDLTAAKIATMLGMSARYVNQIVYETGASVGERIMEHRLQHAREALMRRSNIRQPVIDIAFESGFSDVSYFNRCFKRRFGCTPTQFRP